MNVNPTGIRCLLLVLFVTLSGTTQAEFFKCVVDGEIIFQDHACAAGTQEDLCAAGSESATRHPDLCASAPASVRDQAVGDPGGLAVSRSRYSPGTGAASYRGYSGYSSSYSGDGINDRRISVQGYTRKDGTYVQPHTRSAPRHR